MATKKTGTKTSSKNKKTSSKTTEKVLKAAKVAKKNPWMILTVLSVVAVLLICMYIFKPAQFKVLTNEVRTFVTQSISDMFSKQELNQTLTETPASSSDIPANGTGTSSSAKDVAPTEPENSHMFWGNPSGATNDVKNSENYLMTKGQYALSYNSTTCNPNWVMWHLGTSDLGAADRSNDFRADENLPSAFYAVVKADYQYTKYGFDRGHVCPSADRTASQTDNSATFYMTNMIPQSPDCNRVVWKDFEAYERNLVATGGKELYVVAGPYGVGGESAAGKFDYIVLTGKGSGHQITVPSYCWKIVLVIDEGDNDFNRVNKDSTVIALWMPNAQGIGKTGSWEQFLTSVDYIEEQTGYDFLACIPNEIEDVLEAKVYTVNK
ncbi:MAG: DNA/RNA non-specific endonuclease [Treponema sp.]|nr:DNA/RNA non-specific endonuclease [Treponema sp.]